MTLQGFLCRLFVDLERNHVIGLQSAAHLPHHHDRVAAVRAGGCRRVFITDDLSTAGVAHVTAQRAFFALLPRAAGRGLPVHFVGLCVLYFFLMRGKRFGVKLRVAVRALYLLNFTVKFHSAAAARTFVFFNFRHLLSSPHSSTQVATFRHGHFHQTGRRTAGRTSAGARGLPAPSRTCHSGTSVSPPAFSRRSLHRNCPCSLYRKSRSSRRYPASLPRSSGRNCR